MATSDIVDDVKVVASLPPLATTDGTRTGTAVDLFGYRAAMVIVDVGARTDGTHTPSLLESDDNSSYTAVAAGNLQGSFTAIAGSGQQNAVQQVGYIGTCRYLKAKIVTTGSTTGVVVGMHIVKALPTNLPAA